MFRLIHFPIKGTYYYAADLAVENALIQPNTVLSLKAEPDNPYDRHAVQIWLPTHFQASSQTKRYAPTPQQSNQQNTQSQATGLLLGYVPRQLAPVIEEHLQKHNSLNPQVIHRACLGNMIEIDCAVQLELSAMQRVKLFATTLWVNLIHRMRRIKHFFTR